MKWAIPFIGCLVLIPASAEASDWQLAAQGVKRTFYIDASSITSPVNGWIKVWVKIDYSADATVKASYSIQHWSFNCGQHTMRIGDTTSYDKSGVVLSTTSAGSPTFDVTPDSVGQGVETLVCPKNSN